jgi:radical SAM protein with 4Fe4S-binding SPASM domain
MKVGNVFEGIDTKALERMAGIRTSQMKSSLDCSSCLAQRECFGGCHCRYVGQRRNDLDYRFDVPVDYCRCHQAALTGMLQGAVIARTIRPFGRERKRRASLRLHEEEP